MLGILAERFGVLPVLRRISAQQTELYVCSDRASRSANLHQCPCPFYSSRAGYFSQQNRITQVCQHLYSPELAPCDFWLFPKLKSPLKRRRFVNATVTKYTSSVSGVSLPADQTHGRVTVHGYAVRSPLTGCQDTSRPRDRFSRYSKWTDTFRTAPSYQQIFKPVSLPADQTHGRMTIYGCAVRYPLIVCKVTSRPREQFSRYSKWTDTFQRAPVYERIFKPVSLPADQTHGRVTVYECAVRSPLTGCQVTSRPRERFSRYSKWTDTFRTAPVYERIFKPVSLPADQTHGRVTVYRCAVRSPLTGCQVTSRPRERFSRYSKWTDSFRTAPVYERIFKHVTNTHIYITYFNQPTTGINVTARPD